MLRGREEAERVRVEIAEMLKQSLGQVHAHPERECTVPAMREGERKQRELDCREAQDKSDKRPHSGARRERKSVSE